MRLLFTAHFNRAYGDAPGPIRRAFEKQSLLLLHNPRHPSLRAKKYNEAEGKWQARVNQDWRFFFRIIDDAYVMTDITRHPK
jgi:plasmid maintenance system killer protein